MERTLENLDQHISDALTTLKDAREIADHSPTAENRLTVQECQDDLDYLLDVKLDHTPQK